ncbi:c-type cytochrome [Pseudoalteromonas sp. T1lg65]|uniref:c-type cytochrome n=1 Tax=Pseudoalteromonas sp. T1lg65 TaxID=2077101 RepID=UPI003F7B2DB3
MKRFVIAACLSAGFITSVSANPMFESAEEAIEYRKANFQLIRYQIGNMGDMLKGKVPFDAEVFKQRANNVAQLSQMPWEAFIEGSDKGETDALPAIWTNRAEFDGKAKQFAEYAQALAVAAKSGDKDKIAPAFRNWAKGCKDCHKSFKD